jgi:hypothetical protein
MFNLFGDNRSHIIKIFRVKKRIIRIMVRCKIGSHVGICLRGWKFYILYINMSFHLRFLYLKTKITLIEVKRITLELKIFQ